MKIKKIQIRKIDLIAIILFVLIGAYSNLPFNHDKTNSEIDKHIKLKAENGYSVDHKKLKSFGPSGDFDPLYYIVTGVELPENVELEYSYGAPDGSTENRLIKLSNRLVI